MKNIIGQAIYMVTILMVILMAGEYFIPEDCYTITGRYNEIDHSVLLR